MKFKYAKRLAVDPVYLPGFLVAPNRPVDSLVEKEECRAGRGASPFRSKADPRLDIPDKVGIGLGKGSERTARRILELLAGGPMSPSELREAFGIKSRIHFSRYYMTPLM